MGGMFLTTPTFMTTAATAATNGDEIIWSKT
jgi:hypothetical protein